MEGKEGDEEGRICKGWVEAVNGMVFGVVSRLTANWGLERVVSQGRGVFNNHQVSLESGGLVGTFSYGT